tara:strand:+ start:99292 stop:100347 length:1056 start_codon:yes stop_codon:yes gene_type:complete
MAKQTILLTGAAGYVGAMLVDQWSKRDDVEEIIALDMVDPEEFVKDAPKTTWIKANTSDNSWQEIAAKKNPTVVVHAAWQIRNLYWNPKKQWKWNVEGSQNMFDFAFATKSVKNLVYFSSASIFGADPKNEIDHLFDTDAPLRDEVYLYAKEKRIAEENLHNMVVDKRDDLDISIVRPAAISGPRGRYGRIRFGLQSALSGKLKGSFVYSIVTMLTSFIPATKKWCRQFIHEDDIADIITILTFDGAPNTVSLYNLTPPGDVVLPEDMGEATGKKIVILPPFVIRIVFFFMRHLTFGKVPTAAGAWRFYCYPIAMDGTKVTEELGHKYAYSSKEAFVTKEGRYSYVVPKDA